MTNDELKQRVREILDNNYPVCDHDEYDVIKKFYIEQAEQAILDLMLEVITMPSDQDDLDVHVYQLRQLIKGAK